jgi:glucokinase
MENADALLLVADIGATNSRFALYQPGRGLAHEVVLPTAGHASFALVLESLAQRLPVAPAQAELAVLAVAGPVVSGRFCQMPNAAYPVDLAALPGGLLPEKSVLVNDFTAQALGCRTLGPQGTRTVLEGDMDQSLTQAVIGAGSGLGKAALIPDGRGGVLVAASEGGHAAFPFVNREETAFMEFVRLATGEPYARWETVVSGGGLSLIHAFHTGKRLSPAEAAAELGPDSPVAAWFARFYGRACRDWALATVATGGVYVSGGVAAKNPILALHPCFAREFRLSKTHAGLLGTIPVRLVLDQTVGLRGAAAHARFLLESGWARS